MEEEKFREWGPDDLFMWLSTVHDLMPDEEKMEDEGLDGSTISLFINDDTMDIGLSPRSQKVAQDAISELLAKYPDDPVQQPMIDDPLPDKDKPYQDPLPDKPYHDSDKDDAEDQPIDEPPSDMVMKHELWL